MKAEYINPFIKASNNVLFQVAGLNTELGKICLKDSSFKANQISILIGLTGDLKGKVVVGMNKNIALTIASKMMGNIEIQDLDYMSESAISEVGNMILGNSATFLSEIGIKVDITPPTLLTGENTIISMNQPKTISIPLKTDIGIIELDVAIKD